MLDYIKKQFKIRGSTGIKGVTRVFRQLDSYDGNKQVDAAEFKVGLQECGLELTKAQESLLFEFLDTDKSGTINFDEFLVGLRGRLNERREAAVMKAFYVMDKDKSGKIEFKEIESRYNVKHHPKVQNGTMTPEQALREFMANFADKNRDGTITKKEWLEYYSAISANIDNDDHFVLLMRNAYGLE